MRRFGEPKGLGSQPIVLLLSVVVLWCLLLLLVEERSRVGLGTSATVNGTVGYDEESRRIEEGGMRCCSVYREAQRMQRSR